MGEIGSVATVQVRRQIDGKNETKEINAKRAVAWELITHQENCIEQTLTKMA